MAPRTLKAAKAIASNSVQPPTPSGDAYWDADVRDRALKLAIELAVGHGSSVDTVIRSAGKIEVYLRGEPQVEMLRRAFKSDNPTVKSALEQLQVALKMAT